MSFITSKTDTNEITIQTKDEPLTLVFPLNTTIKINENSTIIIAGSVMDIDYENRPHVLKVKNIFCSIIVVSGNVDVVTGNKSVLKFFAPRIRFETKSEGFYKIVVDGKNTTIVAISGKISVSGVSKQDKFEINEKTIGLITPAVPLINIEKSVGSNRSEINVKNIEEEDYNNLKSYFNVLKQQSDQMLFVVIDKNVIGVSNK